MRVASGLFRLWVVFSVLWLAGVGAYTFVAYRDAAPPDLTKGHIFDDMLPAYEHCWKTSDGSTKVDRDGWIAVGALAQIAECEREVDRWLILRSGVLFAVGIPIILLAFGWAFIWAFRGFLPPRS